MFVLSSWQEIDEANERRARGCLSADTAEVASLRDTVLSSPCERTVTPLQRGGQRWGSDVDRGDNCRQENIFIAREGGVGRRTSGSKYSISQASIPLAFFYVIFEPLHYEKNGRNQK